MLQDTCETTRRRVKGLMFGGTIEGNDARKLMENCNTMITEMEEYVLEAPTRIAGTDVEI
jgi:hypothetical protein